MRHLLREAFMLSRLALAAAFILVSLTPSAPAGAGREIRDLAKQLAQLLDAKKMESIRGRRCADARQLLRRALFPRHATVWWPPSTRPRSMLTDLLARKDYRGGLAELAVRVDAPSPSCS